MNCFLASIFIGTLLQLVTGMSAAVAQWGDAAPWANSGGCRGCPNEPYVAWRVATVVGMVMKFRIYLYVLLHFWKN